MLLIDARVSFLQPSLDVGVFCYISQVSFASLYETV